MKKNTQKMKLNLDELEVESFITSSEVKADGACHYSDCITHCGYTCSSTCDYSCGQNTCNGGPC